MALTSAQGRGDVTESHRGVVRGRVLDGSTGVPGAIVIALARDLRREPTQLGKTESSDDGSYEIDLDSDESDERGSTELIVRVVRAGTSDVLGEASAFVARGAGAVIDVVLAAPSGSEWDVLTDTITPLLVGQDADGQALQPADLGDSDVLRIIATSQLDAELDWRAFDMAEADYAPASYVARHRACPVHGSIGAAARGTDTGRMALATRILANVVGLSPAETAAALEYLRQLRKGGIADLTHRRETNVFSPPDDAVRPVTWEPPQHTSIGPPQDAGQNPRTLRAPALRSGAHLPDPPDVVVRALGPLKVVVHGTAVRTWGGARIRTIFQYLLLHRRPVHREVLMELLWPGYSPGSARNSLNVSMHGLRRALGTGGSQRYVIHRDGYYALNPDVAWSLDCARFEQAADRARRAATAGQVEIALVQAQRAVDEYGGPLFEGDPMAEWCNAERIALTELFLQNLECLARLNLDRADVDAAEFALRRLLREDGCRESAHRLLMVCYGRRNQRDLIARQFRRCIRTLEKELDVAPSDETVQLYRQLTDAS
jgi:DNA-binding SARP family transcriptional activator